MCPLRSYRLVAVLTLTPNIPSNGEQLSQTVPEQAEPPVSVITIQAWRRRTPGYFPGMLHESRFHHNADTEHHRQLLAHTRPEEP
jgi:hypothetical protein